MSAIPDTSASIFSGNAGLVLDRAKFHEPMLKRWNREGYHRLAEFGLIPEKRVELIDGEIYGQCPHSPDHFWAIDVVACLLEGVFGESYWTRRQGPCVYGEWSEPEPDVTVVRGKIEEYSEHPTTAVLAVEVSKFSLSYDRGRKASLYAAMGVPDYWVLDLNNRQLWVYRLPVVDESIQFGHHYSQIEAISSEGHVAPLEKPDMKIAVADMLPPAK
jgi:Uma2 family endonuclease